MKALTLFLQENTETDFSKYYAFEKSRKFAKDFNIWKIT
jgi:hypothetical protein